MNRGRLRRRASDSKSVFSTTTEWVSPWLCCGRLRFSSRENVFSWVGPGKKSGNKDSGDKSTLLTAQQRLIITKTWHKLSVDLPALGISTMGKVLDFDFEIRNLFDFDISKSRDIQEDPRYRQHALWFVQAISAVVENLDNLDNTVTDMFIEIGEKHALIPCFRVSFLSVLPDVMHPVWEEFLRERYTNPSEKAWDRIFRWIADRLTEGYDQCTVELNTAVVDSFSNMSIGNSSEYSGFSNDDTTSIPPSPSPSANVLPIQQQGPENVVGLRAKGAQFLKAITTEETLGTSTSIDVESVDVLDSSEGDPMGPSTAATPTLLVISEASTAERSELKGESSRSRQEVGKEPPSPRSAQGGSSDVRRESQPRRSVVKGSRPWSSAEHGRQPRNSVEQGVQPPSSMDKRPSKSRMEKDLESRTTLKVVGSRSRQGSAEMSRSHLRVSEASSQKRPSFGDSIEGSQTQSTSGEGSKPRPNGSKIAHQRRKSSMGKAKSQASPRKSSQPDAFTPPESESRKLSTTSDPVPPKLPPDKEGLSPGSGPPEVPRQSLPPSEEPPPLGYSSPPSLAAPRSPSRSDRSGSQAESLTSTDSRRRNTAERESLFDLLTKKSHLT